MTKSVKKVSFDTITVKVESKIEGALRVHTDLPEGDPFYANVGLVASESAHVEHILDLIIWELSSVDHRRGACITAQIMGVPGRCKAIAALAGLQGFSDHLIKSVRKLMNDSYPISDLRARVVHDPWFIEIGEKKVGQFKSMAYSDQRYGITDISQQEIDDTVRRIRGLKTRAAELRTAFHDALEASRGMQP